MHVRGGPGLCQIIRLFRSGRYAGRFFVDVAVVVVVGLNSGVQLADPVTAVTAP